MTLDVRAGRPPAVWAYPDRLRQAVGNLVTNALRATPSGGSVWLTADAGPDGTTRDHDDRPAAAASLTPWDPRPRYARPRDPMGAAAD